MDQTPAAVAVKQLAEPLERTPLSWRTGSTGEVHAEFAWLRVWPAHRWQHGRAADAVPDRETEARWLLVEWRSDGSIRYALSNVPPETTMLEAVGLWKSRWQVEQGSQQLKEELGLDHAAGGSPWPAMLAGLSVSIQLPVLQGQAHLPLRIYVTRNEVVLVDCPVTIDRFQTVDVILSAAKDPLPWAQHHETRILRLRSQARSVQDDNDALNR